MSNEEIASLKQELIDLLHQKSVRFGEFTLASGKTSDFYVDARQTTLHARGSFLIASLILQKLHSEVVAIGGPVTGAIPIVGAVTVLSSHTQTATLVSATLLPSLAAAPSPLTSI